MSFIEGFGDEVPLVFFLSTVLIGFLFLAWKSTEVTEPVINEQSVPFTFTITSNVSVTNNSFQSNRDSSPSSIPESNLLDSISPLVVDPTPTSEPHSEPPIQSTDAPNNHQVTEDEAQAANLPEEVESHLRERKKNSESFTIKLMFLDDTHRTVEANSQQTLKDFRMKNFNVELAANKVVKLIFNGQVLTDEVAKLSQLGLDNNCVVHCLIHSPRQSTTVSSDAAGNTSNDSQNIPNTTGLQDGSIPPRNGVTAEDAGIDVGGLLLPLLIIILGFGWYCQVAYATHFSTAATVALVGLSSLCVFSFFVFSHPITREGLF